MNIVFFGTSEFAIPALRELLASRHKVVSLVTQPDRQKGRNLRLSPPPTKVLALTKGVPVFQPVDASSPESVRHLKTLNADLFVVISFGQILKRAALLVPKIYAINLHGSLLPKYRGAAPTNWAVINGEKSSGVTVIRMNEKMDEGDVMLKKEVGIGDGDTNITLSEKLSELGAGAILEAIDLIEKKMATFSTQDGSAATYAPKLNKKDGLINWGDSAEVIRNRVRGLIPWPGAYTLYENKMLKILKTDIQDASAVEAEPGKVVDIIKGSGIIVSTGSVPIVVTHVQLEGKMAMDAGSFIRGHRIERGYTFRQGPVRF